MLDMSITYKDLGLILVFFVIIVAGAFLVRAFIHLGNILKNLGKLVGKNAENLDRIIKSLPAITENAATLTEQATEIAESFKNEQELIDIALENVTDTIEAVADTAKAINNDLIGGVKKLATTVPAIANFISKRKQNNGAKGGAQAGAGAPGEGAAGKAAKTESGAAGAASGEAGAQNVSVNIAGENIEGAEGGKPARERKARTPRKRSAALASRKKPAEKPRNINIHIR